MNGEIIEKTGLVLLGAGLTYLLKFIGPKAKLVVWYPHSLSYQLDSELTVFTQTCAIQNDGRQAAENVEIVLSREPNFKKVNPELNYKTSSTPSGEFVISIDSLPAKASFRLEMLSYDSLPTRHSIRYKEGVAEEVGFHLQRKWPKAQIVALRILFFLGIAAAAGIGMKLALWAGQPNAP